jgi:recombinational DNA repair protein RecT
MSDQQITPEMQAIVSVEQKRSTLSAAVETRKNILLRNACEYIQAMNPEKQEAFLYRTITALLDEKLADCYQTPQGKMSVFRIIEETLATGLELGKHAYAVPQPVKVGDKWTKVARYDVKREGYHVLLCTNKPIAKELEWAVVFEKDTCSIDPKTQEVSHAMAIGKTRGAPIGVWVTALIITELDDDGKPVTMRKTEYYPEDVILNIRDNHSESWKAFQAGKIATSPWKADPVRMFEKTALKGFCRPWATNKDALAHAIYEEGGETFPTAFDEMSHEEKTEAILNEALPDPAPEAKKDDPSGRGAVADENESHPPDIDEEIEALSKDDKKEKELF